MGTVTFFSDLAFAIIAMLLTLCVRGIKTETENSAVSAILVDVRRPRYTIDTDPF